MQMNETEIPAALAAKIDQRVALMEDKAAEGIAEFAAGAEGRGIAVTPLTEPEDWGVTYDRWERTCDVCGSFTPYGDESFISGTSPRSLKSGIQLLVMWGLCKRCQGLPA